MPFIHVKSLPFQPPLRVSAVVKGITRDLAIGTGIGLDHITATWEFLPSGNYAVSGKAADNQPEESHPVMVDLLSPEFTQLFTLWTSLFELRPNTSGMPETSDSVMSRVRSKILRRHPRRLESEALRRLQRWGKHTQKEENGLLAKMKKIIEECMYLDISRNKPKI